MTQRAAAATGEIRARGLGRVFTIRPFPDPVTEGGAAPPRAAAHARAVGAAGRRPRHRARPGVRDRRPERLGEVDAAEAARWDLRAVDRDARRRRAGRLADRDRRRLPPGVHRSRERLPERGHLRFKRDYVDRHLDEIIGFAEFESFADVPVRTYSSGMYMRLGSSVAMHVQPDVLLLDEVLAVGTSHSSRSASVRSAISNAAAGRSSSSPTIPARWS